MVFHYASSFFLYVPWALLVALYAWSRWRRRRDLQRLGDWRLLRRMVPVEALLRRQKKDLLGLIGAAVLIFAAAGPQFGSRLKEVKHRGIDVFIALDTSRSMLAEDVSPSRLERAKRALGLLVQKLEGNRVGIIAFAKQAVIQCPLTTDIEAAQMFLDILDTNTVPAQGTSIGEAIRLALKSFKKDEKGGKAIVLLTDGEDHKSDPLGAAKEAKERGVVIFTIGIGTTKGEVIKNRDESGRVTEFHKHQGQMVLSRLDDALLTKIAALTGGRYYRSSSTDREIDEIADILNGFDKKEFSSKIYERLEERYQIFALIAFLLLLLEFFTAEKPGQGARLRQRLREPVHFPAVFSKGASALLIALLTSQPAWADLKTHVRKGNKLFKKGDLAGARGEFESAQIDAPEAAFIPYNLAATYYLEGKFEEAQRTYEQAEKIADRPEIRSRIAYNLGHLYFTMGKREAAVEKFKECLKLNPQDFDAKYNIEYIKAGKTPRQPFQPQGGKGDKEKNEPGQKQQQQGGEGESQESSPEEKKPGEISKEDAERILQMMKDQENEKLPNAKPLRMGSGKKDKAKEPVGEDW